MDGRSDIHHIFPKNYLKKLGFVQSDYNQIANYAQTQQEINIKIGDTPPSDYLTEVIDNVGKSKYTGIDSDERLNENLLQNCIPENSQSLEYIEFLKLRRKMIAEKLRKYYFDI